MIPIYSTIVLYDNISTKLHTYTGACMHTCINTHMYHDTHTSLAMVHSDKPWPMMCDDDVILICLCRNTGSLRLWEFIMFYFASFNTQMALLLSYESKKGRNSITGNVKSAYPYFNKDHTHFL